MCNDGDIRNMKFLESLKGSETFLFRPKKMKQNIGELFHPLHIVFPVLIQP